MFGILSPTKIIFTILVVVAVWYGFKWLNRLSQGKARESVEGRKQSGAAGAKAERRSVEEMIACPVCGDFVVSDKAVSCGRGDCPYPR